jgi:SanA protein
MEISMRRILWLAAATLMLLLAAGAGVYGWVQWRYDRLIWTEVERVPAQPVAIVFGAGVRPDGRLSPVLRDRMDAAIDLYRQGRVRKLLVSGGRRSQTYDEPARMLDYAVAQGVPAADIAQDPAGFRTYDTCYRAAAIFGVSQAVLVTQGFHLPRALFTCANMDIKAVGFAADRRAYRASSYYHLRDAVATLRAWLDVKVIRPVPVLGARQAIEL